MSLRVWGCVTCFRAYICARMRKHQTETCGSRSVCLCVRVCVSGRYVVYISCVWCLHQRPPCLYFNTTVWSAPIWSWSLSLCLLSKTLFISPCFPNPRSPTLTVATLVACVCVYAGLSVFCSHGQTQKCPGCFTSVWLPCAPSFLSSFRVFPLNKSEEKHNFCARTFSYGPD